MDSKIEPVAWRYAINYGPDGEQNYANVYDGNGDMVGNLKTPHAIAIVRAMNTAPPEAALLAAEQRGRESERAEAANVAPTNSALDLLLREIEARYPRSNWIMAKGRLNPSEPLYGFQVLQGTDVVLAEGEGNTPDEAIAAAIRKGE